MLDIQEFCRAANEGEQVNIDGFKKYLENFEDIVLWGAGNLGNAIGKRFIELNLKISAYWDIRANDIKQLNGIKVIEPFTGGFNEKKSLMIFCIANVPVGPNLYRKLGEHGWENILKGNDLLQGLICPLSNEKELNTKICNDFDICSVCSCQRLSNIVKNKVLTTTDVEKKDLLSFDRIHFIVNNFCNLKCTHCFMYMNSYPNERKKNMELGRILEDIDLVLEAVHSFGVVNVFGGESFLHPNISLIVKRILEKRNFGSVIVSTNGVANIKPEQLDGFQDGRVRLAFSNYIGSLEPNQEKKFYENISFAKSLGVNAKSQNELPNWNISSTLTNKHNTVEEMKLKKSNCGVVFLYVFNGKVFPCAFALSLYDLGIADYSTDYVDIAASKSTSDLREKIRKLVSRSYLQSCGHCAAPENCLTNKAGQQGFDPRYSIENI